MLGAIIGDIVGSRFEWNNIKTKEFDFLTYPYTDPSCAFFSQRPTHTAFAAIQIKSAALPEPWLKTKSHVDIFAPRACSSSRQDCR